MLWLFLKSVMRLTPYEIRRRLGANPLAESGCTLIPTFNPVSLALEYYQASGNGNVLLQVGACDGGLGDPVRCFLARGNIRAVLVEPIEANFNRLCARYEGMQNVSMLRVAVSHSDGVVSMYRAREDGRWSGNLWVGQVASFSREHLLHHGVQDAEIVEEQVPAMTVQSILNHAGVDEVGFVQIDTEGFDSEIVNMVLNLKARPDFINFEHKHVTRESLAAVLTRLTECGYVWVQSEYDTLAVKEQVAEKWKPY